jgi:hypothetical protein
MAIHFTHSQQWCDVASLDFNLVKDDESGCYPWAQGVGLPHLPHIMEDLK